MSPRALTRRRPNLTAFAGVFAATLMCLLAIGAPLPILPRYVTGPLDGGDVEVGIAVGAFAITAIVFRPIGGRLADRRGRRLVVLVGLALSVVAGLVLFLPLGLPGLIASRMLLGAGEGWVFTAGLAWTVDLAPAERRGQAIAFYGLAVWSGLAVGPLLGELVFALGSYDAVWALCVATPLVGLVIAALVPDRSPSGSRAAPQRPQARIGLVPREALRPGTGLFLASVGYAALAGFVVLHLDDLGIGHGAAVFAAFATTVVLVRLALGRLPDRLGARTTAIASGVAQAAGLALIAAAQSLPMAVAGALVTGAGFSLSFPSFALLVVERADEQRRGAALGALTAFFDAGVALGAPIAGAISALAGYAAAFWVAAALAAAGAVVTATARAAQQLRTSPAPP